MSYGVASAKHRALPPVPVRMKSQAWSAGLARWLSVPTKCQQRALNIVAFHDYYFATSPLRLHVLGTGACFIWILWVYLAISVEEGYRPFVTTNACARYMAILVFPSYAVA